MAPTVYVAGRKSARAVRRKVVVGVIVVISWFGDWGLGMDVEGWAAAVGALHLRLKRVELLLIVWQKRERGLRTIDWR